MKIYCKECPRTLVLTSSSHSLLLQAHHKSQCLVELVPNESIEFLGLRKLTKLEIFGFLGLIEINGDIFAVLIIEKAKVAVPLDNQSVNKILAVEFFCLNKGDYDEYIFNTTDLDRYQQQQLQQQLQVEEEYSNNMDPCYDLKKLLGDGSFFYSNDFDLTNNLQTRGVSDHSLIIDTFQEDYMWNSFMMNEMIGFRNKVDSVKREVLDNNHFLTTVIRGFAKTSKTSVGNSIPANISIISRQSWKRAGTRFNARGIDDEGNVANFVETEIILHVPNKVVCAFTEVRGSVPVFWEQDASSLSLSTPKVQITRLADATEPIFVKHMNTLIQKYGIIHVVNLLSTKSSELELSRRFKDHIRYSITNKNSIKPESLADSDNLVLTEFDFHAATKGGNYAGATKVLRFLNEDLDKFDYFSYSLIKNKVVSKQNGVFRTNCLDCLDRTNLTQQVIASQILLTILRDYNIEPQVNPLDQLSDSSSSNEKKIAMIHNSLWADNGDQISQIYTGTNALKSSFSRSGKMTLGLFLSDATKSVTRMYQNNFVDSKKQVTIDTLLGRIPDISIVKLFDPANEAIEGFLKQNPQVESKYTTESVRTIYVGTFNLNGASVSNGSNISSIINWLVPEQDKFFYSEHPDLYIIGFQEVVELNAANILNADTSKSSLWQNVISNSLNRGIEEEQEEYTLIRAEQMTSLLIMFFLKKKVTNQISNVEGYTKKTGLGGLGGNKGAIAVRFNVGSTSFCFVNSHLASGQQNVIERNNDYDNIKKNIRFNRGFGGISNHDNVIWLGDLNYRIDLSNEEIRPVAIQGNELHDLLNHDQLLQCIHKGVSFAEFYEPEIKFPPTYKFDNGSDNYDSSEKQRAPAWTDRILHKGESLTNLNYNSIWDVKFSDHKPVYSLFEANVKFVDEGKRKKIYDILYHKFTASDHGIEQSVPSLAKIVSSPKLRRKPPSFDNINKNHAISTKPSLPPAAPAPRNFHSTVPSPVPSRKPQAPMGTSMIPQIDLLSLNDDSSPKEQPIEGSSSINSSNSSQAKGSSGVISSATPTPPPPPASRKIFHANDASLNSSSKSDPNIAILANNIKNGPKKAPAVPNKPPPGFSMSILQPKSKSLSSSAIPKADLQLMFEIAKQQSRAQ